MSLKKTLILSMHLFAFGCSAPSGNGSGEKENNDNQNSGADSDQAVSTRCETSQLALAGLRRLTALEFQSSIEDIFPEITQTWGGVALGADPTGPTGFTTDSRSLVVGPQSAEEIFRTALDTASLVSDAEQLAVLLPCSQQTPDSTCGQSFIDTYGPRIYRRPLDDAERNELVSYFDSVLARSNFSLAIKWTLVTLLQSPSFVYRSELGDETGQLSPYEVATQMSYMFSGSTPTSNLVTQAESGQLDEADARISVARELLASPRGQALLLEFFRQWSGFEEVRGAAKDGIDNFAEVREAMVEETRRFLTEVTVTAGGNVSDLLTASYTFPNDVLVNHYGFGSPTGEFTKTDRPENMGIGLLAQGSLLAGKAHPDISSPVFRGLFVYEKLLCGERPPLPDVVPPIKDAPPANTTRERFELSHGTGGCRSCHQTFEPYGFALESFDQAGRYRADENGFVINTSASAETPSGTELDFDGLDDLARQLAADPLVTDCVSGQLAAFAFSGAGGQVCLAEPQRSALASGSNGLLEYFAQLASAPSMTQRGR